MMSGRHFQCLLLLATAHGSPLLRDATAKDSAPSVRRQRGSGSVLQMHTEAPIAFREDGRLWFTSSGAGVGGRVEVEVEIPRTFSTFMRGLMFRSELTEGTAMLFQWDRDGARSFWMENTYMPLDIVYVNSEHRVVSIKQATPLSRMGVPSELPASSAIELPEGWCRRNGVGIGDTAMWKADTTAFIARDAPDFGASRAEVEEAIRDGSYQA
mmetsp:Transcript_133446/g.188512  ORF Transcript_133446/g.188512 Transcript_133446/m.188512 type:complete len:212 (-) Transcript_133446:18-653(-)